MTDYIALGLKYGGFTQLDRAYLQHVLSHLSSEEDKLTFITPPPSVINAYFAEIYQKQSPKAATDYYFDLSKELHLMTAAPSFKEEKPFVRLNLSGKAYGFVYENQKEEAHVFAEKAEEITDSLLFDLARIFPQYKIYLDKNRIKMAPLVFSETVRKDLTPQSSQLSQAAEMADKTVRVSGFNQEEVLELAAPFSGQKYYSFVQRQAIIYIKK
ncbi:cystathionine beta-lyase [Streptococcus chenjunshii]|uniref:Cystathionine beta-lyase n=1 Tax=Streptococcus chenjunshii TaxID=2173853 RepID=A0A372KLJ2_9STRE|nr:cystathionine beta-lyase [Streptococcus chenjunshii]AXQ78397.1 cystathionine beta-lyase [Streptococcus chenjunshii]RFU50534.1 cystathionine beta-lyase [Streptococcus chenjunshii]RFU52794.1 cystathionine beta-lyase [Streptococcus chenjunshii]